MFANNMTTSISAAKDSQLNKRRRFAPNTLPSSINADADQTSPLILDLCDKSPSEQEIEAQLLQVGMRVRKAINDGYQNTPGRRAFTPRPFFNSNRLSPETVSALSNAPETDASVTAGGFARQPLSTATFCGISLAAMAHVSCAPAIAEQKMWSYSTAHKRRQHFEDESDSDDSQEFMPRTPQLGCSDTIAPMPQDYFNITFDGATEGTATPQLEMDVPQQRSHGRKLAQPKSRMRAPAQEPFPVVNPFAQIAPNPPARSTFGHQRMRSCGMEAIDFGEASFLHPRQDVEMDCS